MNNAKKTVLVFRFNPSFKFYPRKGVMCSFLPQKKSVDKHVRNILSRKFLLPNVSSSYNNVVLRFTQEKYSVRKEK